MLSARRSCVTTTSTNTCIYRFKFVRGLRQLLRMKVSFLHAQPSGHARLIHHVCCQILQLGLGVGVIAPVFLICGGGGQGLDPTGIMTLVGITTGTLGAASTMSWYCQRLACEISWRPVERVLRISTLTMVRCNPVPPQHGHGNPLPIDERACICPAQWGDRHDRDFLEEHLTELGFSAQPLQPGDNFEGFKGGKNLQIAGHNFLIHIDPRINNVVEIAALTRLLTGKLPFPDAEGRSTAGSGSQAANGGASMEFGEEKP